MSCVQRCGSGYQMQAFDAIGQIAAGLHRDKGTDGKSHYIHGLAGGFFRDFVGKELVIRFAFNRRIDRKAVDTNKSQAACFSCVVKNSTFVRCTRHAMKIDHASPMDATERRDSRRCSLAIDFDRPRTDSHRVSWPRVLQSLGRFMSPRLMHQRLQQCGRCCRDHDTQPNDLAAPQ